jgi:hypothetical protein
MLSGLDLSRRLERVTAADRFADYCLWDYAPVSDPAGKLRSAALLWQSLAATGASGRIVEACDGLRERLGPFRTVWGVKKFENRYAYEFYFYDYARLERTMPLGRVLDALRPVVDCSLQYPDGRPYFMFSLDLDNHIVDQARKLTDVSIYVGNPGSTVSSGICYNYSANGLRLDNFYFFFDAAKEMDDIRAKVACSAHLDLPGLPMDQILWPELRDCGVIVVANKKLHDGVYFSRIRIDQLILFLKRMDYPSGIIDFVEQNRAGLDHMLYDVGIDYRKTERGLEVVKSAFYGLL